MKKQQGFTLIELMIVVAVIGVLSAIAIPQYQKYVAKAEVASALVTMSGVKTNVEAYTVENGNFPEANTENALGAPQDMELGTISFAPISTTASGAKGSIVFTFNNSVSNSVSSLVSNKVFELARKENGSWKCQAATTGDTVSAELLPKSCR